MFFGERLPKSRTRGRLSCFRKGKGVSISRLLIFCSAAAVSVFAQSRTFTSSDLYKLRSAGGVALSPDGARLAYSVNRNDGAGRPYSQFSIMTLADGHSVAFSKDKDPSGGGEWSPDSQWVAYTCLLYTSDAADE